MINENNFDIKGLTTAEADKAQKEFGFNKLDYKKAFFAQCAKIMVRNMQQNLFIFYKFLQEFL